MLVNEYNAVQCWVPSVVINGIIKLSLFKMFLESLVGVKLDIEEIQMKSTKHAVQNKKIMFMFTYTIKQLRDRLIGK